MRRRAGPTGRARREAGIAARVCVATLACGILWASGVALRVGAKPVDVGGRFSLDTSMIPMPVTLIDEIKLDTPAQRTLLEFEIEAGLDFTATWNNVKLHWDSAINIAGPERVILEAVVPFGPITLKPEVWFAVPFEAVTDVNHYANWIVIPPGDLMFVKTRWGVEASYGGIDYKLLFLLEDVNFPNPNRDFGPLFYPVQSQSFRYGSIVTATAEVAPGVTLTSVTNINADSGSNQVKGHSASGRAYRSCGDLPWFTETLTLRGLKYCGVPFYIGMTVNPLEEPVLKFSGGGSITVGAFGLDLAGSISLFPVGISGFSFSGNLCDSVTVGVSLSENLDFQAASFNCSSSLDLGLMLVQLSGSGTLIAGDGITGFNFAASVTQGTFSGGLNVAITDQKGLFRLSSFSARFSMTNAPVAYAIAVDFGRTGLKRATLSVGVVF